MTGYALIVPELLLLVGAVWSMFAERLPGGDRGSAYVGALAALAAGVLAALQPAAASLFGGLLGFDGPSRYVRIAIALASAVWLLWTAGRGSGRLREAVSLALFAAAGAMLMSSAREIVTLVLAVELATMPAYVLVGYRKSRVSGLEGALKYFLLSMLTTLVMLYGFSFLFGMSGSTFFADFKVRGTGALGIVAALLTLTGLAAKLSAAPFHYWAPDAYEGAESWSVAFVSTVPKLAGAVAMVRVVSAIAPQMPSFASAVAVVAGMSMLLGNLAALTQTDLRRLMAYSGVAHTGYLLLGVAVASAAGYGAAIFYSVAYVFPTLGIMLVSAEEGPTLDDVAGLAQRRPAVAWASVVLLLSLIGIPPFVGFFGKLYLFSSAIPSYAGLVVVAVTMSVVSAGYYLRIVRSMFFKERPAENPAPAVERNALAGVALAICVGLTLLLGVGAGTALTILGTPLP